jgi:hypothetical protein
MVAPGKLRGILTVLIEFAGEFPDAAEELPALPGSFDSNTASLREAMSLWMTILIRRFTDDTYCN